MTASHLAKHFDVSSQHINLVLAELGWIEKAVKGWVPTAQGIELGASREHFKGRPYVTWPENTRKNTILSETLQQSTSVVTERTANITNNGDIKDDPRKAFPAQYRTADGHYVRSRAELAIDNWLYMQSLVHAYERRVPITETIISDFYLPRERLYLEYWGKDDAEYLNRKQKKQELYEKHGLRLVNIEDRHLDNLDDALPKLLIPYGVDCT